MRSQGTLRRRVMEVPSTSMPPPAMGTSPRTALTRVDLPEPLAPSSATDSPLPTARLTSSRMREAPRTTRRSRTLMASTDDAARGEPDGVAGDDAADGDEEVIPE